MVGVGVFVAVAVLVGVGVGVAVAQAPPVLSTTPGPEGGAEPDGADLLPCASIATTL